MKDIPFDLTQEFERDLLPLLKELHRRSMALGIPTVVYCAFKNDGVGYHIHNNACTPAEYTPLPFLLFDLILQTPENAEMVSMAYEFLAGQTQDAELEALANFQGTMQ